MSVERRYCYQVVCDDCATTAGQDDPDGGYTLHFDTDHDALDWAIDNGWTITQDGHLRCRRCSAQHLCHQLGHFYDLWHPCTCHGQIPSHRATGCPLIRVCLYCGHHDQATLTSLPTR